MCKDGMGGGSKGKGENGGFLGFFFFLVVEEDNYSFKEHQLSKGV